MRNRASVGLMLGAGLTPGEVRALDLPAVVIDGGTVKGVPWKLRRRLRGRAEQGIPGPMVFPSTKSTGKPWGKLAQYNAAKEVLQAAGVDDVEGGSFRLRHTFALRQLRRGKAPDEVTRWLGVSNPAVMARYKREISSPVDGI